MGRKSQSRNSFSADSSTWRSSSDSDLSNSYDDAANKNNIQSLSDDSLFVIEETKASRKRQGSQNYWNTIYLCLSIAAVFSIAFLILFSRGRRVATSSEATMIGARMADLETQIGKLSASRAKLQQELDTKKINLSNKGNSLFESIKQMRLNIKRNTLEETIAKKDFVSSTGQEFFEFFMLKPCWQLYSLDKEIADLKAISLPTDVEEVPSTVYKDEARQAAEDAIRNIQSYTTKVTDALIALEREYSDTFLRQDSPERETGDLEKGVSTAAHAAAEEIRQSCEAAIDSLAEYAEDTVSYTDKAKGISGAFGSLFGYKRPTIKNPYFGKTDVTNPAFKLAELIQDKVRGLKTMLDTLVESRCESIPADQLVTAKLEPLWAKSEENIRRLKSNQDVDYSIFKDLMTNAKTDLARAIREAKTVGLVDFKYTPINMYWVPNALPGIIASLETLSGKDIDEAIAEATAILTLQNEINDMDNVLNTQQQQLLTMQTSREAVGSEAGQK